MVDPERGLLLREDIGDPLHRRGALLFVEIYGGHPPIIPIIFEMNGIPTEQDRPRLGQTNQKRLMTGSVARRRDNSYRTVAKDIMVT